MDLIADIGGTNTRCALVDHNGEQHAIEVYPNREHASLSAALHHYLEKQHCQPVFAAIAVAAPITGDNVRMTNRQWHFSIEELRHDLGVQRLQLINDFSAIALSLPQLGVDDAIQVGGGLAVQNKTMAVLGPGTGLGVSGLMPGPSGWTPLAGEGGHASLAVATPREIQVAGLVTRKYGHCSAERLISGPGLVELYNALRELDGDPPAEILPSDISDYADNGDPLAQETLDIFLSLLGSFAGNVALTLGAVGGVYIAGGIAPVLLQRLIDSDFRSRFEAKGRYTGYMQAIPTYVVIHKTPALLGLASIVRMR